MQRHIAVAGSHHEVLVPGRDVAVDDVNIGPSLGGCKQSSVIIGCAVGVDRLKHQHGIVTGIEVTNVGLHDCQWVLALEHAVMVK